MDSLSHLETVAEVAVALAGFSALIALLGGRGGARNKFEAMRLQVMLEASLFVVALSLLPVVLFELHFLDETVWRISAALFLITDVGINIAVWLRSRGLVDHYQPADRIVAPVVTTLGWAADAVVLAVLLGFGSELASGLYLLALYLNLLFAGILFIRFAAATFMHSE